MAFPVSSYGKVSTLNTATLVLNANPLRKGFNVYNNGTVPIYLGQDATVSTTSGIPILPQATAYDSEVFGVYKGAIYSIAGTTSQDTRYWEWTQ